MRSGEISTADSPIGKIVATRLRPRWAGAADADRVGTQAPRPPTDASIGSL